MLSDDQRKLIEEEEQVRHEIRRRLDAENPPASPPAPPAAEGGFGKKLYEFFNSSVGMWLLSSVVLTGGAALLQNIQHAHEIEQKNREQLATHKFEITNRLDEMEFGLRRATTVGQAKAAMDSMFKSKFPLSPELQNRSLGSLYLTMYQLVSGTDKTKSAEAMNFLRRLEDAELALQAETDDNKPLTDSHKDNLRKLLKSIKGLHLSAD